MTEAVIPQDIASWVRLWSLPRRKEAAKLLGAANADPDTLVNSLREAEQTVLFSVFGLRKIANDFPWRLLYKACFPKYYGKLATVRITEGLMAWHRSIDPQDFNPPGEYTYMFWEKLYSSTRDIFTSDNKDYKEIFDKFISGESFTLVLPRWWIISDLHDHPYQIFIRRYPLISLFCASFSPSVRDIFVLFDSPDYEFLTVSHRKKIEVNNSSATGPVISAILLSDTRIPVTSRDLFEVAIAYKNASFAKFMLENERYMKEYSKWLNPSLKKAVETDSVDILALLLMKDRADPTENAYELLELAMHRHCTETIEILLNDSRVTSSAGYKKFFDDNILFLSTLRGFANLKPFLGDHEHSISAELRTKLLISAAECSNVATVTMLLEDGVADPTANNHECLHSTNSSAVVALLLRDGRADPRAQTSRILSKMAASGNTDAVRLLLEDGRIDPQGIIDAYRSEYVDVLELLVAAGHPVPSDSHILEYMVKEGKKDVVGQLLRDGKIDPCARNNKALMLAAESGDKEMLELFLTDRRVNPRADHSKALKCAVKKGSTELVRLLLEDGRADPRSKRGRAFAIAAAARRWDLIKLFMDDGRVRELWDET